MADPKWKRLGYSTEWQYRVARAKELGYDQAAYDRERREQRAQREGFTTANARKRYQRSVRGRTFEGETERFARMSFQSNERRKFKEAQLKKFGITEAEFNRVRRENQAWSVANAGTRWASIQVYDEFIDGRENDWSDDRIGYILSYHAAMVNRKTNYEALPDNKNWYKNGPQGRKRAPRNAAGASQFYYLVKYAKVMSEDEFETRYGRGGIIAANNRKLQP